MQESAAEAGSTAGGADRRVRRDDERREGKSKEELPGKAASAQKNLQQPQQKQQPPAQVSKKVLVKTIKLQQERPYAAASGASSVKPQESERKPQEPSAPEGLNVPVLQAGNSLISLENQKFGSEGFPSEEEAGRADSTNIGDVKLLQAKQSQMSGQQKFDAYDTTAIPKNVTDANY